MTLKQIPPGEFQMGTDSAKIKAVVARAEIQQALREILITEIPQRRVRLTTAFYLASCEVTQAQYEQVMGENPSGFAPGEEHEYGKEVDGIDTRQFPVERTSWFDAVRFCNRLSELEGLTPCYVIEQTPSVRVFIRSRSAQKKPTRSVCSTVVRSKSVDLLRKKSRQALSSLDDVVQSGFEPQGDNPDPVDTYERH